MVNNRDGYSCLGMNDWGSYAWRIIFSGVITRTHTGSRVYIRTANTSSVPIEVPQAIVRLMKSIRKVLVIVAGLGYEINTMNIRTTFSTPPVWRRKTEQLSLIKRTIRRI